MCIGPTTARPCEIDGSYLQRSSRKRRRRTDWWQQSSAYINGAIDDRQPNIGVLLMAYGSPDTPDDIEPYYTHIRHGRTPSAELVEELRERYRLVGGSTPLSDISEATRPAWKAAQCREYEPISRHSSG